MTDMLESMKNDPEVKALMLAKLTAQLEANKVAGAALEAQIASLNPEPVKGPAKPRGPRKASAGIPGSKGHREAITRAVKAKPGMTVAELREALAQAGHDIDPKVLSTNLSIMKKDWETTKGEKGLRVDGTRGNTTYWAK
jgi:hypothetical protein